MVKLTGTEEYDGDGEGIFAYCSPKHVIRFANVPIQLGMGLRNTVKWG